MEKEFNRDTLKGELLKLPMPSALLFALSCAERLFPNYIAFSRKHRWGDPPALREALDFGWRSLGAQDKDYGDIDSLRARCERACPDTEEFDSPLVSPGLDAASSVCLFLDFVENENINIVADIATLCRDTVDMFIQEVEGMDPQDPDFEIRILEHPLMQKELARQRSDLQALKGLKSSRALVADLESRWRNPLASNIGVTV